MAMSFNFSLTTQSHGLIANEDNDMNMVSSNKEEATSLLSAPTSENIDGFAGKDAFGTFSEDKAVAYDTAETAGSVAYDTSETAGSIAYDTSETAGSVASSDCGGGSADSSFSSFC